MTPVKDDAVSLAEELKEFQAEKERLRTVIGSIGGRGAAKRERLLTWIFGIAVLGLFAGDVLRHLFHVDVPLPPLFSIEVGVLLVSIKIILMMRNQAKVEHFQFWILNSIEFRLNKMARQVRSIEKMMVAQQDAGDDGSGKPSG